MGRWVRVELGRRGGRDNPYARANYIWEAEDEDDLPTQKDQLYLRQTLKGREYQEPAPLDSRAGEPKRVNKSGGGYKSGGDRQAVVFRKGKQPLTPVRTDFQDDLAPKREYFTPQEIEYNANGSPIRAFSPGGSDYPVGPKYGDDLYMVHPTYTAAFGIDMYGSNASLMSSPLPRLTNLKGEVQLTPTVINSFSGTRAENGANLNGVMKNQSAKSAAEGAGIAATGTWAWLHLIAYSMGGQDGINPDVPSNLVAGTSESNYYHLAIESAAKRLVTESKQPVKILWQLEGKIDPDWHTAERIIYTVSSISDPLKIAKFTVNTQSHESGYGGDTNAVFSYMKNVLKI